VPLGTAISSRYQCSAKRLRDLEKNQLGDLNEESGKTFPQSQQGFPENIFQLSRFRTADCTCDQMLSHGLDQPALSTDTGYFQVTVSGSGDDLDRIRVTASVEDMIVTPIEAHLNERQKRMVTLLVFIRSLERQTRVCPSIVMPKSPMFTFFPARRKRRGILQTRL
jgi:hypothetical protein